jgi:putative FmdB family regulatory protein
MPFYEYECASCKFYTEVMQKISDTPLRKCPSCGKSTMKKLISAPVFRLKGSGWYETDFKSEKEGKRNLAGDSSEGSDGKPSLAAAPADAKGGNGQSGDAKSSDGKSGDGKSESKAADKGSTADAGAANSSRDSGTGTASRSSAKSTAAKPAKPAAKPASRPTAKAAPRKPAPRAKAKAGKRRGR